MRHVTQTCPVLRMFDEAKLCEFHLDYLGFAVAFQHRFEPGLTLLLSVQRARVHSNSFCTPNAFARAIAASGAQVNI